MARAAQHSSLQALLIRAWTQRGWLARCLWPLAQLFGLLAALRRALYRVGVFAAGRVPVAVVVVGNVIAGGSGKTPVVMALVQHLQARGLRVGVIARGYGRKARGCQEVLPASPVSDVGDEPALIRQATQAPVFVAPRRLDAAHALLEKYPDTQLILCDDGLQHLALQRDLEICVFDDRGVGNGWLLPAGPLREPWPRAVDLVLHTGERPAFAGYTARRTLAAHALRADGSQIALDLLAQQSGNPLLALAAIAKPEDFFAMLRARGLKLAKTLALPDHHDFADWHEQDYAHYTVICTEKDAVKLWQRQADVLAIPLLLRPETAFMEKFDAMLSALVKTGPKRALSSGHGHTTS